MKITVFEGNPALCYGCKSCEQICPTNAITMLENEEGFLFPHIDPASCIECEKCSKSCPVYERNRQDVVFPTSDSVFAVWDKSVERRMESTSGGAFSGLASNVLNQGGIVYGCAWDSNQNLVARHIRIDSVNELHRLKGSKYVQSDGGISYRQAKADLKAGKTVLFSGTGCLIAGLKLFLGKKEYPNLYTVDLVCHGTPSPKMLQAYTDYLSKKHKGKITDLRFRDKKISDPRAFVSYILPNGKKRYSLVGLEPYFNGFSKGLFNRESCFTCRFAAPERPGDITVADYWGIEKVHPELQGSNAQGMSLVLCNSDKGMDLFDSALRKEYNIVASTFEKAAIKNPCLKKPDARPQLRDETFKDLDSKGFEWMANNYLKTPNSWIYRLMPWKLTRLAKKILNKRS